MNLERYLINSTDDIKYTSLLNTRCVIEKRFIYVYMLEEHLQRYIETGKSIFKIGQTDVKVGNRINDQIYHHGWQTITSSAPIIIAIYEVDSNINDKMIQNRICSTVKDSVISKYNKRKSYQHAPSGTEWVDNITISDITMPQNKDIRKRYFCKLLDKAHFKALKRSAKKGNYYMGVWHTHPQKKPTPSPIDWNDWNEILLKDRTGAKYAFFVIIGTNEFRVWIGDYNKKEIVEILETNISDGIYKAGC